MFGESLWQWFFKKPVEAARKLPTGTENSITREMTMQKFSDLVCFGSYVVADFPISMYPRGNWQLLTLGPNS